MEPLIWIAAYVAIGCVFLGVLLGFDWDPDHAFLATLCWPIVGLCLIGFLLVKFGEIIAARASREE